MKTPNGHFSKAKVSISKLMHYIICTTSPKSLINNSANQHGQYLNNNAHPLGLGGEGEDVEHAVLSQTPSGGPQCDGAQASLHQSQVDTLCPLHQGNLWGESMGILII